MSHTVDIVISTLGLSKRAKKAAYGFETVKHTIRCGEAKLVLLASDLSPKTARSVQNICDEHGTEWLCLPFTMQELSGAAGKPCGIFAVADNGFARLIKEQIHRRSTL